MYFNPAELRCLPVVVYPVRLTRLKKEHSIKFSLNILNGQYFKHFLKSVNILYDHSNVTFECRPDILKQTFKKCLTDI